MFTPWRSISDKERQELVSHYRNVFLRTTEGQQVLAHMLGELNLFDQQIDIQGVNERRDYAFRLLMLLGIWDGNKGENIVQALANIPVTMESKQEEQR